ncbi:Glucose/arabinose dehydrogenase, beta-propeller fold [Marinobacter daqiaonensis]|uniref:Glucose/arabinose dehydrogenase, beta-propeller fold n=1 Tax=Marinobacter daqiaonensis TaxID=650891 RepID=A0A1I6GZF3_9GAMM|nr:PQQ-dependent sugar dehydrogenase [Marinobacter daqiaonensis]SFR47529.1 Glucose/arabinose dehydrogenase, beta-propeller fold [Marinobacter daqiaonensis]
MAIDYLTHKTLKNSWRVLGRNLLPWLLAVLVTSVLGSLVQSTLNLINVLEMGTYSTWEEWRRTIIQDLITFAPFYGLIVGVAFLCAFPGALWLARKWPGLRSVLLGTSGAVGLAVAFLAANEVSAIPTLISATRNIVGFVAMMVTGIIGAWVFALTSGRPEFRSQKGFTWTHLAFPIVILIAAFALHLSMRPERQLKIDDYPLENYRVAILVDGLDQPWSMVQLPDGRRLVTERSGNIRIIDVEGALLKQPLEGVPEVFIGVQGGLLDMALSPDFERDRTIFLSYACGSSDANNLCVGRGELHGGELRDFRRIFQAEPLKDTGVQFGSRIEFLPDDTMVVSVGDGFDYREDAQDLGNHLGKLVRLNMDGSVPEDNPFVGQEGKRPEIYSYGHRNPQGLFYHAESGRLYESEHGPYGGDEVNIIEPGVNYGWPLATEGINYPGSSITPHEELEGMRGPLNHWTPSIAPSGITVYRGDGFPEFNGDLLVSGLAGRGVFRLKLEDGDLVSDQRLFHELDKRIRDVVVGEEGELYLLTDGKSGEVIRIDPADDVEAD